MTRATCSLPSGTTGLADEPIAARAPQTTGTSATGGLSTSRNIKPLRGLSPSLVEVAYR
jgi:hypothetical protein